MDSDEKDDLYHLLGRSKRIEPSPYFVRNVLRAVRQQPRSSWRSWLLFPRLAAVAAVILLAFGTFLLKDNSENAALADLTNPTDFEVVTNLDDLIAYADNSLWLSDNSNY